MVLVLQGCHSDSLVLLFAEKPPDEMESLYNHLRAASLSPIGGAKRKDFRASFIRRCENNKMNEKLHMLRILSSTLKVRIRCVFVHLDVQVGVAYVLTFGPASKSLRLTGMRIFSFLITKFDFSFIKSQNKHCFKAVFC